MTETPDQKRNQVAVEGTFPASDAITPTSNSGTMAAPMADIRHAADSEVGGESTPVRARFPDAESAKLAVEGLVRDGPIDRRRADTRDEAGGVVVEIAALPADAERLAGLLEKAGGAPA